MNKSFPALLFVVALIGLTGISTAKAEGLESYSVKCLHHDKVLYENQSVHLMFDTTTNPVRGEPRFIQFLTSDHRKVYINENCVFTQRLPADDDKFPEDGPSKR